MSETLESERLSERITIRLSESSYQFLKQQKQQTGKSLSYLDTYTNFWTPFLNSTK